MKKKQPRVDKLKNIEKVGRVILKNPLLSEREIAKQAKVWNGTAHNMKKELEQIWAKSQFVLDVLELDRDIIKKGLKIIQDKLNNEEEVKNLKPSEISQVIKENTARYTLFVGTATDDDWGVKETKPNLDDPEQLKQAIKNLLS